MSEIDPLPTWLEHASANPYLPKSERAIWLQIYDRLNSALRDGAVNAGERLPSETVLAQCFGVTRVTLRRALRHLQNEGLLEARKGVGIFARRPGMVYQVGTGKRFAESFDSVEGRMTTRTVALTKSRPSADAIEALAIPETAEVILLTRLHLQDSYPVYLAVKELPAELFPNFAEVYALDHSISAVFKAHGIPKFSWAETRVSGGFAEAEEADLLHLTPRTPVLRTLSFNHAPNGSRIEFTRGCWPLDQVQLRFLPR